MTTPEPRSRPVVYHDPHGWTWRCDAPFHTKRPRRGQTYDTAAEAWEAAHHHAGHHATKTPPRRHT